MQHRTKLGPRPGHRKEKRKVVIPSLPRGYVPKHSARPCHKGLSPPLRSRLKANSFRLRVNSNAWACGRRSGYKPQHLCFSMGRTAHRGSSCGPHCFPWHMSVLLRLQSVRRLVDLIQVLGFRSPLPRRRECGYIYQSVTALLFKKENFGGKRCFRFRK